MGLLSITPSRHACGISANMPACGKPPRRRTTAAALDAQAFKLPQISAEDLPLIASMRELFGPKLPEGTEYTPAYPPDPALRNISFTCNYDEGFCGHFSVPGSGGAAARFDDITSQPKVFEFIRDHLEFRPLYYKDPVSAEDADEIVIFAPGLNTLHMTKPGWWDETTTPQRLVHYAGVRARAFHCSCMRDVVAPGAPCLRHGGFMRAAAPRPGDARCAMLATPSCACWSSDAHM